VPPFAALWRTYGPAPTGFSFRVPQQPLRATAHEPVRGPQRLVDDRQGDRLAQVDPDQVVAHGLDRTERLDVGQEVGRFGTRSRSAAFTAAALSGVPSLGLRSAAA
jgi:hypothetical protein